MKVSPPQSMQNGMLALSLAATTQVLVVSYLATSSSLATSIPAAQVEHHRRRNTAKAPTAMEYNHR